MTKNKHKESDKRRFDCSYDRQDSLPSSHNCLALSTQLRNDIATTQQYRKHRQQHRLYCSNSSCSEGDNNFEDVFPIFMYTKLVSQMRMLAVGERLLMRR